MITATVQGDSLILTADDESREELADAGNYARREQYVLEELHEQWEWMPPENIGALTDGPILAECDGIERDDDGEVIGVGRVAWFSNYQITDPWAELRDTGSVSLDLHT